MNRAIRFLVFQDSTSGMNKFFASFENAGMNIISVSISTQGELILALESEDWDFVLFFEPKKNIQPGAACKTMLNQSENTPFILISDTFSEQQIVEYIRLGATDCLKLSQIDRLASIVYREMNRKSAIHTILGKQHLDRFHFLAEKMAALEYLIPGISHDLQNLNAIISLNIQTLVLYTRKMLDEIEEIHEDDADYRIMKMPLNEFREQCEETLENTEYGEGRVSTLVSLLKSHIQAEYHKPKNPKPLKEVLESITLLLKKQITKTVQNFEVEISDHIPEIMIRPAMLEQAIINLLVNALQASDKPDSTIRLSVRQISKMKIRIIVEDNGYGIEKAAQEKIFDPFFSTKDPDSGTGLGLFIAKKIIEEHDGKLTFDSRPGHGSKFIITLPVISE